MREDILKSIITENDEKIVLVIADGLGGLPDSATGRTELETARTPILDGLARNGGAAGLSVAIGYGITPGSGPSHLALFGYDPVENLIGRGILEASGIDFPLEPQDLAVRGNFATLRNGLITDRRAGRIPTEENQRIVELLGRELKEIEGVQVILRTVKEHRFVVVFRGAGLEAGLTENDPEREGLAPLEIRPLLPAAAFAARIVSLFVARVVELLRSEKSANYPLLRGFARKPALPSFRDRYRLKSAAIATYPMYRGLARLVGMDVLATGDTLASEVATLKKHYRNYDFFYLHVKKTDSYGEDGNFAAKVKVIEELDGLVGEVLGLKPSVLAITGDHSTPARLAGHSWHPNPFLLASEWALTDQLAAFSERECRRGSFGVFPATEIMPLLLAHSRRLKKFGA